MFIPFKNALSLSCVMLVSACQQPVTASKTPQTGHLVALVAASNWTRDYCQRADIPDQQTLIRSALTLTKARGLNTAQTSSQTDTTAIAQRYDALTQDVHSVSQKCAALNASLAPFLQGISPAKK